MSLFPIFVKLEERLVVVIGGGHIAEAKIPGLLSAGARIRLAAPSITPQIAEWVRFGKIDWLPKEFEPADLDGAFGNSGDFRPRRERSRIPRGGDPRTVVQCRRRHRSLPLLLRRRRSARRFTNRDFHERQESLARAAPTEGIRSAIRPGI